MLDGLDAAAMSPADPLSPAPLPAPFAHAEALQPDPLQQDADADRRFAGVARLHGGDGYRRLRQSHAVVVGIGGVGSWTAEALARSAVGRITLIDLDHVAESNVNRQIHALTSTVGEAKVQAMAARIAQIDPDCRIDLIDDFVTPENVERLMTPFAGAGVVIDCIDQVPAKAALIAWCRRQRVPVVSCGAGGGRLDPTRLREDDLARVSGDPLLSKLRYRLRREHGFPRDGGGRVRKFGVRAVFSDEPVRTPVTDSAAACDVDAVLGSHGLACSGYGSSVTVTAPMGFAAAAAGLRLLLGAAARPMASRPAVAEVPPSHAGPRVRVSLR